MSKEKKLLKILGHFSTMTPKTYFIWNIDKAPLGVKPRLKGECKNLRLVLWISENHTSSTNWNESTSIFTNQGSGIYKWALLSQYPWLTILFIWMGLRSSVLLLDHSRYQTSSAPCFPPFNCLYLEIQEENLPFLSLLLPFRSLASAVVASPLQKDKNQEFILVRNCL